MKRVLMIITAISLALLASCSQTGEGSEELINSVREAETAFAEMAQRDGLRAAFVAYAHPDAVLNRGELIKGKDEIDRYYSDPNFDQITLKWSPSYIDVSSSGDMAYTYGPYELIRTDSAGNSVTNQGTFHTVWKRMSDGSWKYVYD
ncbi:YybH family protein [Fulvivirga sedimenti]|uniref:DUF4440 domain-containing protein n=1 Tax=Fulvivirga sedimenti TaxID=2879465 RepID=A0A9X1HMF3_9BACT|nr:DUF4440 domain-containing protein [Fulvivirga sedimenti]MCA6074833.1 DUF4440 domain-containing protein [Fulvivirga sedimenti]MCA6076010.1 DUF4440 domain-containing protein [Fulvivirga sedimenti]MCA6077138.1 DUF4440 domain-containing protein [Fulvivirga sedimenti]